MPESPPIMVDADGHLLEPRDTWERYLEAKYRDRAIRIDTEDGVEVILVDGKPLEAVRGRTALLGGIEMDPAEAMRPGKYRYEDGCPPGSYDPAARLVVMDQSWPFGSVASEVITQVCERGFDWLDAQPIRVNSDDVPGPFAV